MFGLLRSIVARFFLKLVKIWVEIIALYILGKKGNMEKIYRKKMYGVVLWTIFHELWNKIIKLIPDLLAGPSTVG